MSVRIVKIAIVCLLLLTLVRTSLPAFSGAASRGDFTLTTPSHSLAGAILSRLTASRHVFLELFVFIVVVRLASTTGSLLMSNHQRMTAEEEDVIIEEVLDIFGRPQPPSSGEYHSTDPSDFIRQFSHGF
ncbi:hypothetical protein BV898_09339 [Hypsibius exemplaris]|uniref:Uncharacterized protein n=1 Tax=Hypsibius exemplaris TaxID=2072580 RepID=A0A1W0WMQ5_HYPEX|nr:hypothetical protein BV898_09339 [Hypsibius exemplaris]